MNIRRKIIFIFCLSVLFSIPFFPLTSAQADDAYEENDSRTSAWHPGYDWERTWLSDINGLGIQADNDWYQIEVDPGSTLIQVDCRFTHAEGDIDISLYNPSGSFVASSNSETDNEFISYSPTMSGTFYILVHYGNAGNTYDLWWDDVKEDAYEDNDTLETAWHPGYDWERTWLSDINGLGNQADDDWYRIDVDPGSDHVQVDCQFSHAEGDIDIALYDSSGTLVAVSNSTTDDEFIDQAVSSSGAYYIRVYKSNAENTYNLWWNDIREDVYEENDTLETAWHPGYDWEGMWLSEIAGLGTQTDADWYRIDIDPGSERVKIECRFTHAGGDIDVALYDSSGILLAVSNSVTDDEFMDYTTSSSGTYYILVYCSNVGNSYDLRWGHNFVTVISGLGEESSGNIETFADDYSNKDWEQIAWEAYNAANGEARIATGDIDGDGWDEIVIGLGPVSGDPTIPGGWFEVLDDNCIHLAWGRINWWPYNNANGESWPACGDIDGDGRDEIIIGLGSYPTYGGWFEIFDYDAGVLTHKLWGRVPWSPYNSANGEVRPACGDIDGDGTDEIIIGLGSYPANGGWFGVFDYDAGILTRKLWGRINWSPYNSANGETRPACGDIDGDGRDEIIIGLGSYPANGGWFEVFDYTAGSLVHKAWGRVNYPSYNSANGETRPACGDIDGDGRDEIVVGLGGGGAGWFEVFDDDYTHLQWGQINWSPYNSANGETWLAVKE